MAGVRLLPLMASSATGSLVGGILSAKKNLTAHTLLAASAFQVLGYGLMSSVGSTSAVTAGQYGYQIFLGLGVGLAFVSVTCMMELQAEPQWIGETSFKEIWHTLTKK